MSVPVVNIREMRMLVDDDDVLMPMSMRGISVPLERVLMLMVRVVRVHVVVLEGLMDMFVFVVLGQVQPYAPGH